MIRFENLMKVASPALFAVFAYSCVDDDPVPTTEVSGTLTVENVLQAKTLVESGTFEGTDANAPLIFPGESTSFSFSAAKGQTVTFAMMYGWSNDIFIAPEIPGISLYDDNGNPVEGDVSNQVKLWDNGSRVNQTPGADVDHPGVAENKSIREVDGTDDQGNTYLATPQLVNATIAYNGNSTFTLTIENTSGGTANETPFSPGVWSVSYIAGDNLLNPSPIYQTGESTTSGLTKLSEMGDNSEIADDLAENTGIFTPLSPILVVVYNGVENPIFKEGEADRGEGLTALAQSGNATDLASALKDEPGIQSVYILPDPQNTVLLPAIGSDPGGKVSQVLSLKEGDKIAIATMYGFSNDWFFALGDSGISADQRGDISSFVKLFDDGSAVNQFPGAGFTQRNLGGSPEEENIPIQEVPNPNAFTTLPDLSKLVKVTLN